MSRVPRSTAGVPSLGLDPPSKEVPWSTLTRMVEKASHHISYRKFPNLARSEVDWSGKCQKPMKLSWHAYRVPGGPVRPKMIIVGPGLASYYRLTAWVMCRQCTRCRRSKALNWERRCVSEFNAATRTWLGTLTFRPEVHVTAKNVARLLEAEAGRDFDALASDVQFGILHQLLSRETTRYMKRLRYAYSGPIRFIMVCEAHQSGDPHYHLLIHQVPGADPLLKRTLVDHWCGGFCSFRLVKDEKGARYVAKYIGKDMSNSRVRASQYYGVDAGSPPIDPVRRLGADHARGALRTSYEQRTLSTSPEAGGGAGRESEPPPVQGTELPNPDRREEREAL